VKALSGTDDLPLTANAGTFLNGSNGSVAEIIIQELREAAFERLADQVTIVRGFAAPLEATISEI